MTCKRWVRDSYFRTWFLFDASLVTLDILTISAAGILA